MATTMMSPRRAAPAGHRLVGRSQLSRRRPRGGDGVLDRRRAERDSLCEHLGARTAESLGGGADVHRPAHRLLRYELRDEPRHLGESARARHPIIREVDCVEHERRELHSESCVVEVAHAA